MILSEEKGIDISNTFLRKGFMEPRELERDDNNLEHIARHNVSPDEGEEVAFDDEEIA
jgi:hypothetical protein